MRGKGSSGDAIRRRRRSSPKRQPSTATNSRKRENNPPSPRARELTTKRRGELAELAFAHKATGLGFAVSKPYGDSERYDFIVDSHEPDLTPKLSRVQVKCSTKLFNGLYHVNAHRRISGRAVAYKLTEVDFLAAYIIPEDSWFILPLRDVVGVTSLLFRRKRDRRPGLYSRYREAWHLLRQQACHPEGSEGYRP